MSCLYLVNRPLTLSTIDELNSMLSELDAVLLIEDAVYAVCQFTQSPLNAVTGILIPDCKTRGVRLDQCQLKQLKDYSEMLDWVLTYDKTVTWSI